MNYKINWDDGVFAVPDGVADCLKLATGKAVKVLIYLLKYRSLPDDPAGIGVTEEDIEDAVNYWTQVGVICGENGSFSGAKPAATVKAKADAENREADVRVIAPVPEQTLQKAQSVQAEAPKTVIKPHKALLPTQIAEKAAASEEVAFLFKQSQAILGRALTFDDQSTLLWIYEHLGMSADIILMLISQCFSMGRRTMAKIEQTAVKWHDKGIATLEQAQDELLLMQKAHSYEGQVKSRMGIQTEITPSQRKFIEEWAAQGISLDLIEKAYYINIEMKGKLAFNYINGILKNWTENGITTVSEAEEFDARPKENVRAKGSRSKNPTPAPVDEASQPSFDISLMFENARKNLGTGSSDERKDA